MSMCLFRTHRCVNSGSVSDALIAIGVLNFYVALVVRVTAGVAASRDVHGLSRWSVFYRWSLRVGLVPGQCSGLRRLPAGSVSRSVSRFAQAPCRLGVPVSVPVCAGVRMGRSMSRSALASAQAWCLGHRPGLRRRPRGLVSRSEYQSAQVSERAWCSLWCWC